MGNWQITIHGVGPHDNACCDSDANRLCAAFVKQLKESGHSIGSAMFVAGTQYDVRDMVPIVVHVDNKRIELFSCEVSPLQLMALAGDLNSSGRKLVAIGSDGDTEIEMGKRMFVNAGDRFATVPIGHL